MAHDLTGHIETVTDRLGRFTTVTYNDGGYVLQRKRAVPVGGSLTPVVETSTYDDRGNQLTQTNALGHTRQFTYNSLNKVLSETTALGHVTTHAYDGMGHELSRTLPITTTSTWTFDQRGNLE